MKALGILIIIVGVLASLAFGVVFMFVGGITEIVKGIQAHPMNGTSLAWGIFRVAFASFVTTIGCWGSVALGAFLMTSDDL